MLIILQVVLASVLQINLPCTEVYFLFLLQYVKYMRSAKINLISLNFFIVEIVNIENVKIERIANVVYCV